MDDFENRLGQILGNPEMMGKIMAMAQSFGGNEVPPEPPPEEKAPQIDLAAIQKLTGLMGQAGMDREQKALLTALSPFVSTERIRKLERAMKAAKLAGVATAFLGNSQLFSGR